MKFLHTYPKFIDILLLMLKHAIPDNDDDVQAKEVEEWEDDDDDDASLKEMLEVGDEDDMNMTRLKTMFGTMRGES